MTPSTRPAGIETDQAPEPGRILYASLVDVSLPNGPGVNERVFLKDFLRRYGARLHAVVPQPSAGLPEELDGLSATFLPGRRSSRRLVGWLQVRTLGALAVRRAIARFRPDLIVMRFSTFPLPQVVGARSAHVPYVLKTLGDVHQVKHYRRYPVARLAGGFNVWLIRDLVRGAACIDLVSSHMRDHVLSFEPSVAARTHVIDNGVDTDHFDGVRSPEDRERLGFNPAEVVIGFVGNFPMRRGAREVIDAVAELRRTRPARGLIIGDSGEADACRKYARERGVAADVLILGECGYDDVPGLMGCMDIGVSVLRPGERAESEQKVRQYLASGLCVVGTAGSNDFLRGRPFARVVESAASDDVVRATSSFLELGRERLAELGHDAHTFARSELSVTARNDERLRLWAAVAGTPGGD